MLKVSCDSSWAGEHGIGRVYKECISRPKAGHELDFFDIKAKKRNLLYPLAFSMAAHKAESDVVWSVGFFPPAIAKKPVVVTVHDLTHLHFYSKAHRAYYDVVLKPLYRKADKIITVSDFTRDELLEWSGCDPDRVVTVLNAVGEDFGAEGKKVDKGWPYLLYPGNRRPYKNIRRMIEAFARSKAPSKGIRLLLTGKSDDTVMAWANEYKVADRVEFCGYLSDEHIPEYYRSSLGVVYISLYEGFGLPIIEAMASGRPVITSNISSMPEVAGTHGILVDPYSIDDISQAMNQIVDGSVDSETDIQNRISWACNFTWERSAQKLWNEVEKTAKK